MKSLKNIAKKYSLSFIILFGSLAKNRARQESDVDLAIFEKKPLTLNKELLLRKELFEIFKRESDLAFIRKAEPLLLGQIAQYGKLLYGDEKRFKEFRVYAMKQNLDFEPYFKLQEKLIRRKLKQHA